MSVATYVLGHKNPDADAICAAIGYTALLHLQGQPEAVAAR
jgi:manganese-dependent inorganic pyrophosphatase